MTGRVEVTTSVSEDAPPVSIRVMRGGRLVHEFHEPAEPACPANSNEPQESAA